MICIDCLEEKTATIVQYARLHDDSLRSWHICHSCAQAFERRKDAAASEWREQESALKNALARIPFGQVTPAVVRKQRRAG